MSLTIELLILCTREYPLLRMRSRLLVACALRVAIRAAPDGDNVQWTESIAARCGYPSRVITEHCLAHLAFLNGWEIRCRRLASGRRERSLRVVVSNEVLE